MHLNNALLFTSAAVIGNSFVPLAKRKLNSASSALHFSLLPLTLVHLKHEAGTSSVISILFLYNLGYKIVVNPFLFIFFLLVVKISNLYESFNVFVLELLSSFLLSEFSLPK